jgi:hypothetical protein
MERGLAHAPQAVVLLLADFVFAHTKSPERAKCEAELRARAKRFDRNL